MKRTYENTVRVLESKVGNLQNEMKNAKVLHMNLEKSKQLCEQKLIDLDKKHNGKWKIRVTFDLLVY